MSNRTLNIRNKKKTWQIYMVNCIPFLQARGVPNSGTPCPLALRVQYYSRDSGLGVGLGSSIRVAGGPTWGSEFPIFREGW